MCPPPPFAPLSYAALAVGVVGCYAGVCFSLSAGTPFQVVCALRVLGPLALALSRCVSFVCWCALALVSLPLFLSGFAPPPLSIRAHSVRSPLRGLVGPFHDVPAPARFLFGFLPPYFSSERRGGGFAFLSPFSTPYWRLANGRMTSGTRASDHTCLGV